MEKSGRAIVCIVSFFRLTAAGKPSEEDRNGPGRDVSPARPNARVWIEAAHVGGKRRKIKSSRGGYGRRGVCEP